MKNIYAQKKMLSFFLVFLFVLIVSTGSHGGNIVVKPGKFDHFGVQLPEKVRAGEGFVVRLQAYDAHNNFITDFGEAGKDFKVLVSGSAQAQPPILKANAFAGGAAGISITDKKAETITLSVFEVSGTVPLLTKEITVLPNKPDHFIVQSPQSVTAGGNFDVKISARDAFDNAATDTYIESKNIKISYSGSINFKVINVQPVFRDGAAIVTLMSEKVGEAVVEVNDIGTGSKGTGAKVRVAPAALSYFKIYAPKEAAAGETFEAAISAFDAFDNLIENYSAYGNGVNIASTGQGKISPSFIAQSDFRSGQAIVKMRYEKAEDISILATENNNKNQQGKSAPVKINPSTPDNFNVITPDVAVAGQKFRIKVEASDRFNNMVKNYNIVGSDVYLTVTGTGSLSPKSVSASEFVDGIASLDVMYDKAESFAVSASMTSKREEKKVSLKEYKEEIKPAEKQKPVEKMPVPKPKPLEATEISEKPATPAPKEEKITAKAVEKPIEKKEPIKDKKTKEGFFEIKKVSIIEARNKAMVIVNMKPTEETLQFNEEKEIINGKEWIKVSLKPAVNKTKKVWKFKSALVKEIHIDEDKTSKGVLYIKVELFNPATIDINRVKDSLVVSIATP